MGRAWETSPLFFALYAIWSATLALALFWFACSPNHRLRREQNRRARLDKEDSDDESRLPRTMMDGEESNTTVLELEYFQYSRAELVAKCALVGNGLALLSAFLVICIDFYLGCENDWSLDNLCFFGRFAWFGNYKQNSEAFFAVWLGIVAYSVVVSFFSQNLLQWTRVRVPNANGADLVRIFVPDKPAQTAVHASRMSLGVWLKRVVLQPSMAKLEGRYYSIPIQRTSLAQTPYFVFETVRYDARTGARISQSLNKSLDGTTTMRSVALDWFDGNALDLRARAQAQDYCGLNQIPLDSPTLPTQVLREFTSPFYAYQFTIYLIWIYFTYWFVGIILLSIVIASGLGQVFLKWRAMNEMHALAAHRDGVSVRQSDGSFASSPTALDLVPGDVVRVEGSRASWTVPADLILCQGSCAVDESGLTGESMPRSKTATTREEVGSVGAHSILYAGTTVLEASMDAQAVVLAIGSDATRGRMLSQVLFPSKIVFQFDEEYTIALILLFAYAVFACVLSIALQSREAGPATWTTILTYGILTVSQILSPMIKIALVAGRVAATKRLRAKGIACMDQDRLDICGKVEVFCFDKTGTLTEPSGLKLLGVVDPGRAAVGDGNVLIPVHLATTPDFAKLCATCHSLAGFNGKLLGPSVEVEMFSGNGQYVMMNENAYLDSKTGHRLAVRKRFQFDQTRRTMSVVVIDGDDAAAAHKEEEAGRCIVYVKGAPESIASRCTFDKCETGTDMIALANELSAQGCYVLAMATKQGHTDELSTRDQVECDLEYLGLIAFRNELKPDAALALRELKRGKVRTVMITGDNLACANFIALQSGMAMRSLTEYKPQQSMHLLQRDVDDLAVTGESFDALRASGELSPLLPRIRVFARMSPSQKVQAVQAFMDLGLICAMAGDGGNDSGALRAAHAGLSYSACEASVVAPFSSRNERVFACVDLLIEGRVSMHTSLSTYKFLVTYGLVFSIVKFVSFYYGVLMSLMGYILIDMLAMIPLTYFMTTGRGLGHLGPRRPSGSLLGLQTVSSLLGMILIVSTTLLVNLGIMSTTDGYVKWPKQISNSAAWWVISDNWESTVLFQTVYLLFISSSVVFSLGSGFREALYHNWALLGTWAILFSMSTLALLLPANYTLPRLLHNAGEQFNREDAENPVWRAYQALEDGSPSPAMSRELRLSIWFVTIMAIAASLAWEYFVVFGPLGDAIAQSWCGGARSRSKKHVMFISF